jgi:predicted ester cyclase
MKKIVLIIMALAISFCFGFAFKSIITNNFNDNIKMEKVTHDQLIARIVKAGELVVLGDDKDEVASYFDTSNFRFHGPSGFEADYVGLMNYFKSIRAAFDDRSIKRGIIVAEGNYAACQTWIQGKFVREFTQSPEGTLPPNGQPIIFDLINIFRFDDQGRMVEEWVQTDNRSLLSQLSKQN